MKHMYLSTWLRLGVLLCLLVMLSAAILPAQAQPLPTGETFIVNKTEDTADGTCDTDCSLREAITAANSNNNPGQMDIIQLGAETYTLTLTGSEGNTNATGDFDITESVSMQGTSKDLTIIDSDIAKRERIRVFDLNPNNADNIQISINNLTITGGGCNTDGSGINITKGIITITNTMIRDNGCGGGSGGGVNVSNGDVTITHSDIVRNESFSGGINIARGEVTINDSTIISNITSSLGVGGINIARAKVTINRSTISKNGTDDDLGGGIGIANGTLNLNDSTITENEQVGIFNSGGHVTINRSIINKNMSKGDKRGGGIFANDGTTIINHSTITHNTNLFTIRYLYANPGENTVDTTQELIGAGIKAIAGAVVTLNNSTVTHNTLETFPPETNKPIPGQVAEDDVTFNYMPIATGGGIHVSAGTSGGDPTVKSPTVNVYNSTIAHNTVRYPSGPLSFNRTIEGSGKKVTINYVNPVANGGGIYNDDATINIKSSIIANNTASDKGPDIFGEVVSQDYNLIENTQDATITGATTHNIIGKDPKLLALANNGGPTQTHSLDIGSPAIDQGSCPASLTTDQRGQPRLVDFTHIANPAGGNGCDIGAYEREDAAPIAQNDTYTVGAGQTLKPSAPGVLKNDTDPDTDKSKLTAQKVTDPQNGTLTLNPDGAFTYVPKAGFSGSDTFTYTANDGVLDSNTATVTITVTATPNVAPTAQNDTYTTVAGQTLKPSAPGVLMNDTDPDTDKDKLTAQKVADPQNGTLTLNPDGAFTYVPKAGFSGSDTFTYTANDGVSDSNTATVTITVTDKPTPNATDEPTPSATDEPTPGSDVCPGITKVAARADNMPHAPQNMCVNLRRGQPVIMWSDDDNAHWFNIYIIAPDGKLSVNDKWFSKPSVFASSTALSLVQCDNGVCTLAIPEAYPMVGGGEYVVWMQAWGNPDNTPGGGFFSKGGTADVNGTVYERFNTAKFSVPTNRPAQPSNVVATKERISWEPAEYVVWYQIWVGTVIDGKATTYHLQDWIFADKLGCIDKGDTCTLNIPAPLSNGNTSLEAGTYEVWLNSWGPAGFAQGNVNIQGWAKVADLTLNNS